MTIGDDRDYQRNIAQETWKDESSLSYIERQPTSCHFCRTQLPPLVAAKPGVVRALGMNPDLLGHGLVHALLPTSLRMGLLAWLQISMERQSAI